MFCFVLFLFCFVVCIQILPLPSSANVTVGLLYAVFLLQENVRLRRQNHRSAANKQPLLVAGSAMELSQPPRAAPRAAVVAEGALRRVAQLTLPAE